LEDGEECEEKKLISRHIIPSENFIRVRSILDGCGEEETAVGGGCQ
jgi:hypothetical protein